MQFQVPQFIEVEDKIFGPLTFKQFVWLFGGAGLSYILFRVLPIYIAGPLIAVVAGLSASLAFATLNGRPFIVALEHGFYYLLRSKLYLWSNERAPKPKVLETGLDQMKVGGVYVPKLSDSRLRELAWSLDINERIDAGIASEEDRARVSPISSVVAPVRTARDAFGPSASRSTPAVREEALV